MRVAVGTELRRRPGSRTKPVRSGRAERFGVTRLVGWIPLRRDGKVGRSRRMVVPRDGVDGRLSNVRPRAGVLVALPLDRLTGVQLTLPARRVALLRLTLLELRVG